MNKRILSGILYFLTLSAATAAGSLTNPYYVQPRAGGQHIDLSADWELSWRDGQVASISELSSQPKWWKVGHPQSVQMALYHAGELPHPYYNLNSRKYEWVDEKVWYYRKSFALPESAQGQYVFLAFDGIDYFSRVWLNGQLLGEHEGMFGGPVIETAKYARFGAPNDIVVEVRAGNWGNKRGFDSRKPGRIVKPWVLTGGLGAEMFFPLGMWQGARVEIVPKVHMERPFLVTKSVSGQCANLRLKLEVLADVQSLDQEFHTWKNTILSLYRDQSTSKPLPRSLMLEVSLTDKRSGRVALTRRFETKVWEGRNWIEQDLTLPTAKLWWPVGMGEPNLYTVELRLVEGKAAVDTIRFDYGVRTLETLKTLGPQTVDRWENWQFAVNGRKFFVKGMNWMPADLLLDLPREQYHWLLSAAKNAGIQFVRIWGGGLIEPEAFYSVANELGILVWQDFPIGNTFVPDFPQPVWEEQVMQTIFRIRNHPSLAVYCGGNEFNPYGEGNAAAIGIFERSVRDFDPSRPFRRTSPDAGSIHTYPDMDPTWYARQYPLVPFISETGMHNIPNADTLREVVSAEELKRPLSNMFSKEFEDNFPDFRHHFVEFNPKRVPRMLSRASHIDDITAPSIDTLAEGTQIGAGEFYQVFSDALQANYPVTAGLMPWVFKRPWPVVAIQLMDGFGHPTAPYYFLKRTYEETHVLVRLPHLLWTAGESIAIKASAVHANPVPTPGMTLMVEVQDDSFRSLWRKQAPLSLKAGPSVGDVDLGQFEVPKDYQDRFLFVVSELHNSAGKLVSRSVYWPRTLSMLANDQARAEFRAKPTEWPTLAKGPWLKPSVARTRTALQLQVLSAKLSADGDTRVEIQIRNTGKSPSFLTSIDVKGARRAFFAGDNFFWLKPGESRVIPLQLHWRESATGPRSVVASSWNAEAVTVSLP
ncbi:sugar-binding domain-containing protein [uncultured Paludibaculum sp.]|uniref:glycoside hydrolase family 2 protein n=1 Tax=uncultured Paludibaculum sp. TaxID=1765020 RepID=UPI002AABB85B|nr:sugar-binding domain-containing protein [uncultured Paludibaculum sp.]